MEFQKSGLFLGETCSWDFSAPSCHPNTLIELANIFLAENRSVKTLCTVSGSDSTHVEVTGPMNFENTGDLFFVKSCSRDFAVPSWHPCNFKDFKNNAWLVVFSRDHMYALRELQYSWGRHLSNEFQKKPGSFIGESCSLDFSAPSCHPSTFIDIANIVLANRRSVKAICTVSGSDRTHVDVTGPMNFENNYDLFFVKSCSRDFANPTCHPCNFKELINNAWLLVFNRDHMNGLREL